ncbi:peptidase, M48 family [marine gamma proteobacterium HTCC2148]|uniref:M48 family peptidase n=1 Tax=Candidatus Seongchinamella marina TaxID=2518990 RepID=A0ABT3SWN7_9GAMM|nr:M48 family metallopeptidase [Candidatus Seongchinamella marina]EEB78164.1 peptidase, M48 family [marine gamma proteobacterium HTCC2148]MBT3411399.1 M48 family metallopeptidase [Halieaceae bacterium]MBT5006458.1 M48 family metallopeptidase [Halieaceae bacterium]MBT7718634.1 M48 family metallopeptidase [Halieaceae bacterium]MCX2974030.1 M48 family peptidase [Candidatus Seongchinamella marina]
MKRLLLALLALSLLPACVTSPTGRAQLMLISPESAIVESKKAYLSTVSELDKENKLVDDPKLMDRVATITGRLVTVAKQKYPKSANWEWSVAIVDDPKTVNAWCMAGGRMAVYTGLFSELNLTDDEFAQIMGHEISHALANHTAERMSRAMATSLGIIAVSVAADNHGAAMLGAAAAAKVALELPNSRTAELEADNLGMRLATQAGYEPDAAVTLWQKMAKTGGSAPPEFLSTHPAPGNREAQLAAMIPEMRGLNPDGRLAPIAPVQIVR